MKSYRAIPLATKDECLASEYSYALELSIEPTVKDLNLIRELSKECKFKLSRHQEPNKDSSLFESEDLEEAKTFNTLVFGDSGLENITFIIKFYKSQETVSVSGDIIKSLDILVNIDSTVSDEQINVVSPSLTIEGIEEEERIDTDRYKFKPINETITKESYQKFTSRVSQLVEDKEMVMLMGECGISTSEKTWGFWIKEEEDITGFEEIGICIYSEDLCVLKYNKEDKEYSLSSLTKSGPYGNLDYKVGYITVPNSSEYYGICGPNIIYTTEDYYWIYSIYNLGRYSTNGYRVKRVVNNSPNFLITSPWVIYGSLKFSDSYSFYSKLESLSGLTFYQERDEFLGSWEGKYKMRYGDQSEIHYFEGLGYTIDNTGNISWINDNLMLYREKNKIAFVPKLYEVSRIYKDGSKILIVNEEDYNEYSIITLFDPKGSLSSYNRVVLDGLRKKPWKTQFPDLDNIIFFRGLVFYKENNKLLLY